MRNTLLAAVIGAAIAASIVVVLEPSGNEANAQAVMPKARADCVLRHLAAANTDTAVQLLLIVCTRLHG